MLSEKNYSKGFLIDDELMGGVTPHPETKGQYVAFVLRHTTGEYLGYQSFPNLSEALVTLNQVKRDWKYETASGCGGCADGQCGKGACGLKGACGTGKC